MIVSHSGPHMKQRPAMKALFTLIILPLLCLVLPGCLPTNLPIWRGSPLQYGAEGSDDSLLVVLGENLRYGYSDSSGKIVIPPKYREARPFYEGLAAVKYGSKFGYIDKTGKTVIPFEYYDALDFHNGQAFVGTELELAGEVNIVKCCLIDKEGNRLTKAESVAAGDYSDGMMPMGDQYLNFSTGEMNKIPELAWDLETPRFSEGLAAIPSKHAGGYYIDKHGEKAIPGPFCAVRPFSEGLAAAVPDENTGLWGYINKSGEFAIAPQFLEAYEFGEGLACVKNANNYWVIIDTAGNRVSTVYRSIDQVKSFSEGLCPVGRAKADSEGLGYDVSFDWGFIDTTGKVVIDLKYDMVTPFKNGIAQVMYHFEIGYIDKTGKYIWEPK